ncbi:hypothetical protein WIS52_11620 [Pseudonocardia nematodicida]|uniref:DUF4333 domain-containing protein n=1 Tax=Pseudonocardia nematodicida TaxID=1206997 RepID=A0ABV1KAD6_9PSEU
MRNDGPYERYYAERARAGGYATSRRWLLLVLTLPVVIATGLVLLRGLLLEANGTDRVTAPVAVAEIGEYLVGADLHAGDYVTPGPGPDGQSCRYQRSGTGGETVAEATVHGPAAARLLDGETVVFDGGCVWSLR